MLTKLQQPILGGVIGLALTVWLLDLLSHWWQPLRADLGILSIVAIAVGAHFWLRQKPLVDLSTQPKASTAAVNCQLAEAEKMIEQLEAETAGKVQTELRAKVAQVTAELTRSDIRLVVIGSSRVGKTSLIQVLESNWVSQQESCSLVEMPSLFTGATGPDQEEAAPAAALASDLVLFLIQADLMQPEYQTLKDLVAQHQRTLLVLNKIDQYLPTQQSLVQKQVQEQSQHLLSAADIMAIAAAPGPVKVRQYQADGSVQERMEYSQPQVKPLTERLSQVLTQEREQLVLQTTLSQALALKAAAQSQLNLVRRDRALPVVEKFQWIAAATAFTNPLPSLDLLAAAAITGKMVLDLGAIYQQKLSLDQAQAVAKTLASLMLKLGLVEFSTQTLGSLLKSNSVTFVAGGLVQGASAAYLTRLSGLSLIEHFQVLSVQQSSNSALLLSQAGLSKTLEAVFQQNQRLTFLKSLVSQAIHRLCSTPSQQFSSRLDLEALQLEEKLPCISATSLEPTPATST